MSKKSALFIVNPISGLRSHKNIDRLLPKHLDQSLYEWRLEYTRGPGDAARISREAAGKFDVVVAVGGDGSINEVSRGLIDSKSILGIIPAGSGNGLARYLNIPTRIPGAIATLNRGHVKTIDTVLINDDVFVNVAGMGFDARVAQVFASCGQRGLLAYLKSVLTEFYKYPEKEYKFCVDNNSLKQEAFLVSFSNSSQYGLNVHISPRARIDDGMMEVCFLKKAPLWAAPSLAFHLFNKSIDKSPYYSSVRCKKVVMERGDGVDVHIDGDPYEPASRLEIEVNPSSLKVIAAPAH